MNDILAEPRSSRVMPMAEVRERLRADLIAAGKMAE
jgi:hypothetical protein